MYRLKRKYAATLIEIGIEIFLVIEDFALFFSTVTCMWLIFFLNMP